MKTCFKCNRLLPLDEFYKHPQKVDGHLGKCKVCTKKDVSENRSKKRSQYAAYERKRYSERGHRYKYSTPLEYQRKHRRDNPEMHRAFNQKRRAVHAKSEGSYTADEFIAMCENFDNVCIACGGEKPLTVDHVVPLSKGGSNNIDNIQPLCRGCNSSKGTKTTDYRVVSSVSKEQKGD